MRAEAMYKQKNKHNKLVIVGAGEFAEIVYEYFTYDSEYTVEAFAVEKEYYHGDDILRDLPVVCLDEIKDKYPVNEYDVFVAITYAKLNRARTRVFNLCKEMGYTCASYVSSKAFVWHNVELGENVFIFEDNTVQYFVKISDNTVLWSGNHVGHHSVIGANCWITSHCVISGFCEIGDNIFMGVNATLGDKVKVEKDILFAAGAMTVRNLTEVGKIYKGVPAVTNGDSAYAKFGIEED